LPTISEAQNKVLAGVGTPMKDDVCLSWQDNKIKFIFILTCIPMIIFLGFSCFAAIIAWYVILSVLTSRQKTH